MGIGQTTLEVRNVQEEARNVTVVHEVFQTII